MLLRFSSFEHTDLVHAVTTRHGGVSAGPHSTLNLSFSRPDDPAAVRENRRRLYAALEIPAARVVQAGQIHGDDVLVVTDAHAGRGALDRDSVLPPADALITNTPQLYLLACFADCVPLLFFDPVRRAVGVAHAGWQGTVKQIGAATVRAMAAAFGSRPADLQVAIGPSVGPCCYNVWPHVAEHVRAALSSQPEVLIERDGQTFFDLWQSNAATLVASGVQPERIEVSGVCTVHHADRFFSHRATNGATGRFAAIIGMRE
ncbi:MAG TPA: peptidoglycan editing factor PgeF [Herpetosiphonaceae bacterium]